MSLDNLNKRAALRILEFVKQSGLRPSWDNALEQHLNCEFGGTHLDNVMGIRASNEFTVTLTAPKTAGLTVNLVNLLALAAYGADCLLIQEDEAPDPRTYITDFDKFLNFPK